MVGVEPQRIFTNNCQENMEQMSECSKCDIIRVGSRIRCDNSIGTVRYIGEVAGYSGLWYGIDWDDLNRGKHDGTVSGVQYFNASAEKSGSFVRPNKIAPSITCADAIRKYYGEKEDENTSALYQAVIDDWKRQIKVPFIEMVGFETVRKKQSNLENLVQAFVSDMNVCSAGDLTALCPALRLLDVSRSCLAHWRSVADIGRQLPRLERLDLSKNRIELPPTDQEAERLSCCFQNLQKFIMIHCNLDWDQVKRISVMMPHLQELVVSFNSITQIDSALTDNLHNLTQLLLDGNPLHSWSKLENLGKMDKLRVLSLNECGLTDIRLDDRCNGEKSDLFRSLEVLHLKLNSISDWRSISELDKLRSLQKLYFQKNPIMDGEDYDTSLQLIVARIEGLKEFNGSEICRELRRGGEYDYLKRHGKQWKGLQTADEADKIQFLLSHSRFRQLIEKYDLPEDSLLEKKDESHIISSQLIEITLKDERSGDSLKKKLPAGMTVQKLSALVRRLFSAKFGSGYSSRGEPTLYCIYTSKSDASEMTVHLDNQLKELAYFSVAGGDTVLVKW